MDARVPFELLLDAFGVPATVTRPAPDEDPILTTGVWLPPDTESVPTGARVGRREVKRLLAFRVEDVPSLPTRSRVIAAERLGDSEKVWQVDGMAVFDVDHWRVTVVQVPE